MIFTDCGTQSRTEMNESVIAEYAEAMECGDAFPPIQVIYDEAKHRYILVDGFHRYFAHLRAKPNDQIPAEQRIGTVEDAQWESLAANKSHGLRRSNADKRNAVKQALLHPKGASLSDRQIAKHVGVDHKTVSAIRGEIEATGEIPQSDVRIGLDGRTINTAQIGEKYNPNPSESCSNCLNFMASCGECMLDSSKRTPWTPACSELEIIPPETLRRELPPPPEDDVTFDEPKKVKHNTQRYKPRNTIKVDVPLDNPQLAAAELRSSLGEKYLEQCFIAVRLMLVDQE